MKSVQIRSFFWSVFSCIHPNAGKYGPEKSPNAGKYRPEKTPYLDTFHAVIATMKGFLVQKSSRQFTSSKLLQGCFIFGLIESNI